MSGDYNTHNNQQPNINYTDHTVDLSKYSIFVDGVTSDPSKDYQSFIKSITVEVIAIFTTILSSKIMKNHYIEI